MAIPDDLNATLTLQPALLCMDCAGSADLRCLLQHRERVVGRNCKFLQGPGTDPAVIDRLRQALYAPAPKPITVCSVQVPDLPLPRAASVRARAETGASCFPHTFSATASSLPHPQAQSADEESRAVNILLNILRRRYRCGC